VFCHLFADFVNRQIEALLTGSNYPAINSGDVRALEIPVPSVAEQTAIAEVLSDMDSELAALEQRRDKTRAIKQGMMQELLTGRIRLESSPVNVVPFLAPPATVAPAAPAPQKSHNWAINEAVVISVLALHFGSEQYPLGRKRYTKLSYLLHRHVEREAEGYLKKAAGPYNPATKYKGPETIAQKNGYIRQHNNGTYTAFVAADNIANAEAYFQQWYGPDALKWLDQFHYKKNDDLELLATVDMAMEDMRKSGSEPTLAGVKKVIHDHPEWEAKLSRPVFADDQIDRAMQECQDLFMNQGH
jgi:type I restriction enzyme S subunit